jgi:hypothetical protein
LFEALFCDIPHGPPRETVHYRAPQLTFRPERPHVRGRGSDTDLFLPYSTVLSKGDSRCGARKKDKMTTERQTGPRYRVDESVFFSNQSMKTQAQHPVERFIVVSVMPVDRSGTYQYRIRPTGAGPQRVASELELKR